MVRDRGRGPAAFAWRERRGQHNLVGEMDVAGGAVLPPGHELLAWLRGNFFHRLSALPNRAEPAKPILARRCHQDAGSRIQGRHPTNLDTNFAADSLHES